MSILVTFAAIGIALALGSAVALRAQQDNPPIDRGGFR